MTGTMVPDELETGIPCSRCQGSGRVKLPGALFQTILACRVLTMARVPITAPGVFEILVCRRNRVAHPTAVNNRLEKLAEYGFLRLAKRGRGKRRTVWEMVAPFRPAPELFEKEGS